MRLQCSFICTNKTKDTLVPKRERTLLSNTFFHPTNYSANDTLWHYVYDYDYDYDYDYGYDYDY